MSTPPLDVVVPERVLDLARGRRLQPVWRNDYGGITFRVTDETDDAAPVRYLKWGPRNLEWSLADEAERLAWAGRFTRVPHVLEHGQDETEEWLVTVAIEASSAVDPRWVAEPATAVRAVGEGLRALHEALPVEDCPFGWSVEARVANALLRGLTVPDHLLAAPPVDRLVVCHGDACCPNTLIDDDGAFAAHVDLGLLGVADRWADLAVAAMSTEWNYGPGWEDVLVRAYGLEPDRDRLAYYRDLWNAT